MSTGLATIVVVRVLSSVVGAQTVAVDVTTLVAPMMALEVAMATATPAATARPIVSVHELMGFPNGPSPLASAYTLRMPITEVTRAMAPVRVVGPSLVVATGPGVALPDVEPPKRGPELAVHPFALHVPFVTVVRAVSRLGSARLPTSLDGPTVTVVGAIASITTIWSTTAAATRTRRSGLSRASPTPGDGAVGAAAIPTAVTDGAPRLAAMTGPALASLAVWPMRPPLGPTIEAFLVV